MTTPKEPSAEAKEFVSRSNPVAIVENGSHVTMSFRYGDLVTMLDAFASRRVAEAVRREREALADRWEQRAAQIEAIGAWAWRDESQVYRDEAKAIRERKDGST